MKRAVIRTALLVYRLTRQVPGAPDKTRLPG